MATRTVQRIEPAMIRTEGDGLDVRRALPVGMLEHVNPFLLVEEIEPVTPAALLETVQRPARGFEEVTWVLTGSVAHVRRENGVNVPTAIAAGNAEWLTAGRGDVYVERFAAGVEVRLVRVWIALPRKERQAGRLIVVEQPQPDRLQLWDTTGAYAGDAEIDLLAGRLLGARARINPLARTTVARVRLPADVTFVHAVDSLEPGAEAATVVLYALSGQAMVGPDGTEERLLPHELAVLARPAVPSTRPNSDEVRVRTLPGQPFDFLWLSGFPADPRGVEQFTRHGSIVLRTEEEILQSIEDYRAERLGTFV